MRRITHYNPAHPINRAGLVP